MAVTRHHGHQHPANQALHDNPSRTQHAVDSFVAYFGSLKFIAWMTVVIIAWLAVNSLWLTSGLRWDPYPFILLNLAFSAQATYAAPLILLSQNRSAEHDRIKAEHDYTVNEDALAEIRATRELAREVHGLTAEIHQLTVQQMTDLGGISDLSAKTDLIIRAVIPAPGKTRTPKIPKPSPGSTA